MLSNKEYRTLEKLREMEAELTKMAASDLDEQCKEPLRKALNEIQVTTKLLSAKIF